MRLHSDAVLLWNLTRGVSFSLPFLMSSVYFFSDYNIILAGPVDGASKTYNYIDVRTHELVFSNVDFYDW